MSPDLASVTQEFLAARPWLTAALLAGPVITKLAVDLLRRLYPVRGNAAQTTAVLFGALLAGWQAHEAGVYADGFQVDDLLALLILALANGGGATAITEWLANRSRPADPPAGDP